MGAEGEVSCVACGACRLSGREEVLVFENFSGAFQSACGHAACKSCLQNWVLKELPVSRKSWMLRVACPAKGCSRYVPQQLVLQVSAHARDLAQVIETSSQWPSLPNEVMLCPCCQEERDHVFVNTACGHGACQDCWLTDLQSKLIWCKANCALDIPCCHRGCSEGCFEVLKQLESPVLPDVKNYVEHVRAEMLDFSPWSVHEAAAGAPGPLCPACDFQVTAVLHCCCGYTSCKRCLETVTEQKLDWCRENFAFLPGFLHGDACAGHDAFSLLSPSFSALRTQGENLHKQLQLVRSYAVPRGVVGPTCPVCNEVPLVPFLDGINPGNEMKSMSSIYCDRSDR